MTRPENDAAGLPLALALRLAPTGALHLDEQSLPEARLDAASAARIREAFARGVGDGLLHLGAVELEATLPPSLAWFREFARHFVTALRALPAASERTAPGAADLAQELAVPCPTDELARLALAPPPMDGAEYLSPALLAGLWATLTVAMAAQLDAGSGSIEAWLTAQHPAWHAVGRVCFHLAENKRDPARPFAFLATYTTRLSATAKAQHLPLGRALEEYAGARNREALLALLRPVDRAAAESPLVKQLVDSGELFHPLAWSAADAYRFLREIPRLEAAGLVVRVPDWWRARTPPRVQVAVTVGESAAAGFGLDALLDFNVGLAIDGEPVSDAEWRQLLAGSDGLALLRGRWVEVDRERLSGLLAHFRGVQQAAKEGLSFAAGMRLLAGARLDSGRGDAATSDDSATWSHVSAGAWLRPLLEQLRSPTQSRDPGPALRATLRPYQRLGVGWLHFLQRLGLGACLADDMGLGKTIQVIALLLLLRDEPDHGPHLLVAPASLLGNWQAEIERFAPSLRTLVAHPSVTPGERLRGLDAEALRAVDLVLTSYGSLQRLPALSALSWHLAILDEAQAIKNPGARQTRAVKALQARARIALTGTPVENRLGDLWSLFDFLSPGLLGSAKAFTDFTRRLAAAGAADYGPLRSLVRPYILRRLKSDPRVVDDLPDKSEVKAFCGLSKPQAALYQQAVDGLAHDLKQKDSDGMKRRGLIFSYLLRLKQICNHPSQWLGDSAWEAGDSGKFARLRELGEAIAAKQEKALVFTQFREITEPLAGFLAGVFGRPGLVLHGGTPVKERKRLVDRFQQDDDVPFFLLSLKAGGTGLNLTAASHVIHFDRWWNPAVEDQATDRAYRIGQRRNVLVHKFVCRGTVEERIDTLIESKRSLAKELLSSGGEGELLLTELDDRALIDLVSLDIHRALAEP